MLNAMLRTVVSVCLVTVFGAANASAGCLLGLICIGDGGGGSGGSTQPVSVPEIDVTSGAAALALLACIALMLRERFLRAR